MNSLTHTHERTRAAIAAIRSVEFDPPTPEDRILRILSHVEDWRDNRRYWATQHPDDPLAENAAERAQHLLNLCRWEATR